MTKKHRSEQADLADQVRRPGRPGRGPLGRLTLIAFLGYAAMVYVVFFYALFVAKVFIPPIVIEASLILLAAGVLATGWRYAPYLGAVVALLTLYDPIFQPHNIYIFTHPGQSNYEFIILILIIALGLVSLAACITAIIARRQGRGTLETASGLPRYTAVSLSGLAGLLVGMILLSIIVTVVPPNEYSQHWPRWATSHSYDGDQLCPECRAGSERQEPAGGE